MATITRYVNPNSTAGGDGTTNATVGANRAYVSLSAWEAAQQQNLDTGNNIAECICETGGNADSTACVIDGWTTSATDYIIIKTSAGHRHPGYYDATKYRLTARVENYEDYVRFEGLQFRVAAGAFPVFMVSAGEDVRVSRCVFDGCTPNAYYAVVRTDANKLIVHNTVFNNNSSADGLNNILTYNTNVNLYVYNVSIRGSNSGSDQGVTSAYGNTRCRNTVVFNTNGACFVNFATLTNNYCKSDDATADDFGGTGNVASVTLPGSEFVNASGGDLHLAGTSTLLKDAGQDLSSDPDTYGGSIGTELVADIDGTSRTGTWDIGADELASAATKAPPLRRAGLRFFRRLR